MKKELKDNTAGQRFKEEKVKVKQPLSVSSCGASILIFDHSMPERHRERKGI